MGPAFCYTLCITGLPNAGNAKDQMTPAARLQAAIDILGIASDQPLERLAKAFWRERRYAGGGDRRAVGEMLFAIARNRA